MAMTEEEIRRRLEEDIAATGSLPSPITAPAAGPEGLGPIAQQVAPAPATAPATAAPAPAVPLAVAAQPTGFTMSQPPPPPPPPAPPPPVPAASTLTGLPEGDLGDYARDWMAGPNRFLSDLVTQTRATGDERRAFQNEEAVRRLDEWAAGRGLTGSSLEGEERVRLEDALGRARSQEELALLEMMANAEAGDRLGAGQFGLGVAELGRATSLEQQRIDIDRERLAEETQQFEQQFGLAEGELDLRAEQIREQARLEGRSLDIQESRDLADQELRRESMQHEFRMQTDVLSQRESEFARSQNLNEREFLADQDRFTQQFGEQVATRLQQDAQFTTALASDEARFAMDAGLRQSALDLQREGMTADEAFRRAALDQERQLTETAQELQRLGMTQEDAYRWAALNQDSDFRQQVIDLESEGMDLDEAFRRAELDFRNTVSERQDETTRMAILIQAMSALGQWGGLGGDLSAIMDLILEGQAPAPDRDESGGDDSPRSGDDTGTDDREDLGADRGDDTTEDDETYWSLFNDEILNRNTGTGLNP